MSSATSSAVFPTSASASASPSPSGNSDGGSGPTSSPLLFFVALGFGVVFTNLWIIVGVKYCFRYNQRNRAARAAQDGEPIDLAAMPRPHRRRREKKLMTMDEVNERFPLTKYKLWKASREDEGLPAAGGIQTAPTSRAASLKEVEGTVSPGRESTSPDTRPDTALSLAREDHVAATSTSKEGAVSVNADSKEQGGAVVTDNQSDDKTPPRLDKVDTGGTEHYAPGKATDAHGKDADDSDDDDPIRTAAAPELLGEPGDTCAICLDTLEHDDDVRGLTCGHAFHASCVDPWLTARRACCPLCKADYYVPKPRPEGEGPEQPNVSRRGTGLRSPQAPQATWAGGRGNPFSRGRISFHPTGASRQANRNDNAGRGEVPGLRHVFGRPIPAGRAVQGYNTRPARPAARSQRPQTREPSAWRTRLAAPSLPGWLGGSRGTAATDSNTTAQPTPGQLEAGNR